ncbi:MarR family winged helix-turn-helix transcriptional regulator [Paraburkholderia sp. DHOC27]|uniref:MarR family winged helix-turn-helix transcriptional regulator n=1 Tax=Paraburkholderia sp. DHOC27 TaxID=2303330 RepID=UPI000E3CFABE|nr:MarR family transcriptional regulator [Paraburkholderia sp. DHOC27]RFU48994.1 MarR family transcriptional regulator [Paraburkholderia sp. DHOC27]
MHLSEFPDTPDVFPDDDCFAIRQAARYVSQLYDRHLAEVGLTITQYSILRRIRNNPQMTMKQLVKATLLKRTTLVRTVQPLQRDGLVSSRSLPAQGRERILSLTPDGEARLAAAGRHWHAAQEEFEQRFGADRSALLRRELLDIVRAPAGEPMNEPAE